MNPGLRKSIFVITLTCFLVFSITSTIYPQAENADKLISGGKLKWEDFTGEIENTSKYWAVTYWNVSYSYRAVSNYGDTVTLELKVLPALKGNSWVLPDRKSDELLQHEQGHFNFALLLAAEFKKRITSTILLRDSYTQQMSTAFKSILEKIRQMEMQYDEETSHMSNKKEQIRWNEKIEDLLHDTEY